MAGSRHVLELHGTARQAACLDCAARYDIEPLVAQFLIDDRVPDCPACGGRLKHATISFGQMLPADVLMEATRWSREADLMLAIGSSLVVTPAADLPRIAKSNGARLVIINRDPTPLDANRRRRDSQLHRQNIDLHEFKDHNIKPAMVLPVPASRRRWYRRFSLRVLFAN